MKHLLVKDWMETDVISASPKLGMLKAHKLMREHKIRRLPVIKSDGTLIGIVTRSDIRRAEPSEATTLNVWEMNYLLAELKLSDIMTKNPITIHAEDTIKTAAIRLHENKIGALPVVDGDNHLVGIITESDIFRVLINWFNQETGETDTE
ncbi:MAG: CBS domain-containing protein [Anaerolineae bacterium]|nr:CBS domain-containing protein [Anaerolineae bacterium]MCO5190767.1 CBS domain-containing protein [Anaerolineae bacterium]MCO5192491.1 CBS domain-containing protein [Anaerolineae bacterium]MCO5199900.1 CBS domain-containing protein [Anaerolineae bacterium]MCO5207334.1 CBS domain-containing protein [Anaerolineae bacterium]